jgi:protein O-GlcNAc transferase
MLNLQKTLQHALTLCQTGQLLEAKKIYSKLIKAIPSNSEVLTNLGTIELQLGNFESGVKFLKKSISINPNQPHAISNLGNRLLELGCYIDAISYYDKAILINSGFVSAYYNKGKALTKLNDFEGAINCYNKAIEIAPDYLMAYINLGVILNELKRYEEAICQFNFAIKLEPYFSEAYYNLGVSLDIQKRYGDALANYDRAIQLKPDYAEAFKNRGATFHELKRYDDALANYDRAIQLKPEIDYLLGDLIHTKMLLCDWENYNQFLNKLIDKTENNEKVSSPFVVLTLTDNPKIQKHSAEIFVKEKHPVSAALPKIKKHLKHQKIRIGYFSADFCNHPVSYLTAELFELHNRDQFEIFAFSFGVNTQDPLRQRLEKSFDQFIDVREKSDEQIALLAREIGIDIAVDLGGFTQGYRVNIFAMRAAPIQVSYIGYLGTMGAEYFEYLVADQFLIPQDKQQCYSEKIVYLPSYQVNDSQREVSEKIFTREEVGLPENSFVFCCFNSIYKITPATFDSWMRILNEVDDSVLLLLDDNETATKNLKKEAVSRGIDANRIVFGKHMPLPEYLARYRIADLFLDTLPYNAGTTASDALRVGLPVLTQMGESLASRIAASLLKAVGLPELITTIPKAYESLAIELATNPGQLRKIKNKLVSNLPTSPLYNTNLFTQHIEFAYQEMYQHYQDELSPDHIYIKN